MMSAICFVCTIDALLPSESSRCRRRTLCIAVDGVVYNGVLACVKRDKQSEKSCGVHAEPCPADQNLFLLF